MLKWIFIITLLGLCFQPSCSRQPQFVLFQTPKPWNEAQSICREKCVDLATINSMREMETVLEVVKDKYDAAVWIGLWSRTTPRWHWSLADRDFYKEGERNYYNWSFVHDQRNCGTYTAGKMRMSSCVLLLYAVCFDGTKQGAGQYILTTQNMVWTDARNYCRTHHTDLTSLRNDAEYQMVQKAVGGLEVWVGLFRDTWAWSDQSDSSLRYWNANQSVSTQNYSCGGLMKTEAGKWGELRCEETHPFLCDCTKSLRLIKMRISPQALEADLEDPLVQENVLEQMKQWLRNQNVTADVHLKWQKRADGRVFIKDP